MLWGVVSLAGFLLTHGLRGFIRRQGWLALPTGALLLRIVAATLVLTLVFYGVSLLMSQQVYGSRVAPITQAFYQRLTFAGQLRNQFIIMLAVQCAWVALYLAFALMRHRHRAELRQAQLGEALQTAELRLLQSQLNPHFLFNALNCVRSLIAEDTDRARDAVTHLARMLRYTLASSAEDLVTLARELEMVDDYLALESMRLAERLRIQRDIDPEASTVRVPAMLLQTLVENAIKHGIAALKPGGTLRISAKVADGMLALRVENPRPADAVAALTGGVGLRNASERLRLLFGARAALKLEFPAPDQAVAEVRLPA
jgi:LytS/YehU family sensor histidine kinase